ncbi:hypothetical protein [Taibaiella soli]|uniref:Uncharacterized protein n=1 Tax=Taibaiella soli TaxID=1649169 RepID=A0A2W2AV62_9BACT|nr:hypothetical protein [Taibaiella soli]PZF71834.1 hypothetical protein DN068_17390 [Taibaiella soli]
MSYVIRHRGWGYWIYLLVLVFWAIFFTNTMLEPAHGSIVSGKEIAYFVIVQWFQLDLILFLVYAVNFLHDLKQGDISWVHFPILLINCFLSSVYACQYCNDDDLGFWQFLLIGKLLLISLACLILLAWTAVKFATSDDV